MCDCALLPCQRLGRPEWKQFRKVQACGVVTQCRQGQLSVRLEQSFFVFAGMHILNGYENHSEDIQLVRSWALEPSNSQCMIASSENRMHSVVSDSPVACVQNMPVTVTARLHEWRNSELKHQHFVMETTGMQWIDFLFGRPEPFCGCRQTVGPNVAEKSRTLLHRKRG